MPYRSALVYPVWITTLVVALGVSLGVAPMLRGAGVGLGPWIDRVDQVGAWLTQVAAVSGSLLLIQLMVDSARRAAVRPASALAAIFSIVPSFVMLLAMEGPVYGPLENLNVISMLGLGALVTLTRLFSAPRAALVPALTLISMTSRLLLSLGESPAPIAVVLTWLSLGAGLLAALTFALGAPPGRARTPKESAAMAAPLLLSVGAGEGLLRTMLGPLDPLLVSGSSGVPLLQRILALMLPVALYLTWRRPADSGRLGRPLFLVACFTPVSPLMVAAVCIAFLLMNLEPKKLPIS